MADRSKRWSRAETIYLITAMEDLRIIERSDGRKYKNAELLRTVSAKLNEVGYVNRDVHQVQNKWKQLKQEYNKAKAKNKTSGSDPSNWPFFDEMDRVMGGRPMATADEHGVDCDFGEEGETETANYESDDVHNVSSVSVEDSDQTDVERPGSSLAGDDGDLGDAASVPDATNTLPIRKKTPKAKSGYQKTLQTWSAEQKLMMEEMQVREHQWAEQQQERRDQREQQRDVQEENLITRIMEQNTRSTERLVGMMFEGLRTLLPPAQPVPPPPQYHYPQYYPVPHQQPHNTVYNTFVYNTVYVSNSHFGAVLQFRGAKILPH